MRNVRTLALASTLVLVPAALALVSFQKPIERATPTPVTDGKTHTYVGTSEEGKFQEALDAALELASDAAAKTGADQQFTWVLGPVTGTRGGITGKRAIAVTITTTP